MNTKAISSVFALALCAAGAHAQGTDSPAPRVPAHTPEFTHPSTGDPASTGDRQIELRRAAPADSVADDLQRIVVLCATQPQSQEFETAWTNYLRTHYRRGVDVDAVIDDVLRRAEAHRTHSGDSRRDSTRLEVDANATRRRMHDTAMAVIRKIG